MNQARAAAWDTLPLLELLNQEFDHAHLPGILGMHEPRLAFEIWSAALHGPLSAFLSRPSKEFRSNLLRLSFELAGGQGHCPEKLPLLVEMIHNGSLIIDDIEDESEMRRGRPALHQQVGVPVALNSGNWLYFWALAQLERQGLEPAVELEFHRMLSRTLLRCHYGQALDLRMTMANLHQSQVFDVVSSATHLKTGCLLELSTRMGAAAAGAAEAVVEALARFGCELGIALQMLDDHGGLVNQQRCHKGHEDLLLGRPTWPWAWLATSSSPAEFSKLQRLARRVQARTENPERLAVALSEALSGRGRLHIRHHLRRSMKELRSILGPSPGFGKLSLELKRLEQSYG